MSEKALTTITVTRNTAASGTHFAQGTVLAVGKDISPADANALIAARKAVAGGEAKTRRARGEGSRAGAAGSQAGGSDAGGAGGGSDDAAGGQSADADTEGDDANHADQAS